MVYNVVVRYIMWCLTIVPRFVRGMLLGGSPVTRREFLDLRRDVWRIEKRLSRAGGAEPDAGAAAPVTKAQFPPGYELVYPYLKEYPWRPENDLPAITVPEVEDAVP